MKIKETGFILFLENYEENVSFYSDKLGLELREKKTGLSKFNFAGSYLMIEDRGVASSSEKTRAQNPTIIRLEVQDFEETINELRGRNVSVNVYTFDWGNNWCHCRSRRKPN